MVIVQNVSKRFRLYGRVSDRLLEALPFGSNRLHSEFWALKNVSFSVQPGEILGIVGPNGSGKSTLLQVVSGILQPTTGRVSVEGRVAALLELGAGFNPEFSGRENVFLNGEIMGLSRSETQKLFPLIEAFAEIGDYINRPVKEYSSGMYVRLAFATAIHVDPDVLIVDEALAVGDAIFANRCIKKLDELKQRKVTILFVSHDLGIVKRLCHRAILMLNGQVACTGTPTDVVNRYVALVHDQQAFCTSSEKLSGNSRHGDGTSAIDAISIFSSTGDDTCTVRSGEQVVVRLSASFRRASIHPVAGILIRNRLGTDVFGTNTNVEDTTLGEFQPGDSASVDFEFRCQLSRGEYTITAAMQNADGSSQDWIDDAVAFTVISEKQTAGIATFETRVTCRTERPS